jgi:heme exporter protein D
MDFVMDLGPHAGFIISAYVVTALVVALLVAWVAVDHRSQKRALADLERRGVTRRSAEPRPAPVKEPA